MGALSIYIAYFSVYLADIQYLGHFWKILSYLPIAIECSHLRLQLFIFL